MMNRFFTGMVKSFKFLFVNDLTKELAWNFRNRDKYLEYTLNEICSNCPLHNISESNNGSGLNLSAIDTCRMKYFGKLLESFVGRPGDDETIKLYSYLRKCEECKTLKKGNVFSSKKSSLVIKD